MSHNTTIAVVGAGASGLMCAILCAQHDIQVDVYEQNEKCGKKILVSGNGRCNISNTNISQYDYFSQNPSFVEYTLQKFGFKEFQKFTDSIGLFLDIKSDGRAYPLSNEAKSVVKIFEDYAISLGVHFKTQTKITNIKQLLQKYDKVVIATGSEAASHLGGSSDGYEFAKELGHNIVPTYPSLVQLHLNSEVAKKMSGAKTNAEVTLFLNNQKECTINGDILFTNYGISGFAILDLSQKASFALLHYNAVDISLNLLPMFNTQKLSTHIVSLSKKVPNMTILDILVGLIPLKIAQNLLDTIEVSHKLLAQEVHTKLAKKIASTLVNWKFEVTKTHGFRHAEVSGGGVDTTQINPKTMESLKHKNIYFCGEVLDVVGKRGGYNFAWAWASAYVAAEDISRSF